MLGAEKESVYSASATVCPRCRGAGVLAQASCEGYYFRARVWSTTPASARARISVQRARDAQRIAALGDTWGVRLDELGASYRMVRWTGAPRFVADREKRYRALVALLEEHGQARDVGKRFAALCEAMPAVGRWAERKR